MSPTRYRVVLSLLGILLGVVVVAAVILAPSGNTSVLPEAIERYTPADGAIVQRQTALEIDLRPGYALTLTIDGQEIPLVELDVTPATGLYVFRPGADKTITEWTPGFHVIDVSFDTTTGAPDPGSLHWSFRTL